MLDILDYGNCFVGRQFNKDGDLEQWWDQNIIDQFKQKAQCIVDQYGSFFVSEANMTVFQEQYLQRCLLEINQIFTN